MSWEIETPQTQTQTPQTQTIKIFIDNELFREVPREVQHVRESIIDAARSKGYAKVYVLYRNVDGELKPLSPDELEDRINEIQEIHIYKLDYAG